MFTLAASVRYEEEIKKSRFEAIAVPVENEQDVKAFLDAVKDPSTTHQCWVLMMMVNLLAPQVVQF